jgi:enoyl-CoA hydratase/carnithine racemase
MSPSLAISREGRVLRIALNRPEKRNALSVAMCRELVSALGTAGEDRAVGAILLEARGSVFCAGMDLEEALAPGAHERMEVHEELFSFGARMLKPVVAAVQGPALAGGTGLVANAHVAVAAEGVSFGLTEIRIGMWPFVIYRAVVQVLGEKRAVELSLTGRVFDANEALRWGLVHYVTPAAVLANRALAIASELAESSPEAIRLGLTFVHAARDLSYDEAGRLALESRARAFLSADFQEGVRAFRGKRKPEWPSRGA